MLCMYYSMSWYSKQFAEPILVLFFNCPKEIAKERYLTHNLEGREADNEAMFEKWYKEYIEENKEIVYKY